MDIVTTYYVIDRTTRRKVGGPYKTKQRARTARDKHDNAYGCYQHAISDNSGFIV